MTTNLLNNLSNVLKKGPSETQKNSRSCEAQSAAEKSNRVLITCLSRVNLLIKVRCMRYAALLLVLLLAGIGNAWGAMELANINFKSWTPQSISAGSTVNGCYFKSAVTITAADGATFAENATTSSNWVAIPLSGINGSITITLTHASSRPQWKNYFKGLNAAPSSSDLSSNPSSVGDNTRPGSNTTTSSWTINTDKLYGVFYVGKGSNGLNDIYSITITTPDWTYYYRGADNSWGADAMTKSSEGFYSYKSSSTNDHQFKIAKSTSSWDYNYSFVDAGYLGTSITTISSGDNNNCHISSAPASYYIIVFRPGSAMNTTANPKICASATLPAEKFTISFNNGGGSGSMSSISNVVYGSEKATTANTFTKSGYRFTGWHANVDVKVGGATKTAGTLLDDEVTIQEIKSDITLTAQWEVDDGCNKIFWFAKAADATAAGVENNTTTFSGVNSGSNSASGSIIIDGTEYSVSGRGSTNSTSITFSVPANKVGTLYGLATTSSSSGVARTLTLTNTASYSETQSTSTSQSVAGEFTFTDMPAGSYTLAWDGNGAECMLCLKTCDAPAGCDATQPGAISKGTLSSCSLPLTASGSPVSNNTWYWQSAANGTDKTGTSGATKNVTSTGTYYIRSYYSTGDCWSEAQSVTVSASDLTPAAPTALAKSDVTAKGVTLTVTDAANTNDYEFYVSTSSSTPSSGTTATHSVTSAKSLTITNLYAGTTFYAWARAKCGSYKSAWTALTGNTFTTSTVTVTHTLTNVSKTSGEATAGGSDYTAVYAADAEYSMPTPTVTIDGNTATSGTDYTWNAGTGTITIPANKINGNIVITLNSVPSAPSSAVISGTYHYFPGENISLTCTPSGNNGPTTYQWYKGGKENGNAIEGATSATYTKNSCTFDDAGSYYCKVTCNATSIWAVTNSHENYDVKILRLYVKGSKGGQDYGNVDFVKVNSTTATASISLGSNWTYGFNIADGCGHYYGNSGTMQYNSYGPWVTNQNGVDCGLTTTNAATYVFTINYSNLEMIETTVTFPSGNQTSGKVIYFDNNDLQWENVYYRIGKNDHVQSAAMTKVYGTANLYQYTTPTYNNFAGWHITNAAGATGSYSVYNTKNGTAITEATAFEGAAVTQAAVTVTPTSSHATGETSDNNNCEFYTYGITTGMKTQNVAISDYSNGTITVNYTNTSNEAATLTSGNADLAHSVILTSITAVPNTGYDASAITINGGAYSANYVVTGATTIAASFTPHVYNITLNKGDHGAANQSATVTYLDDELASITHVTSTGYTLTGYYDGETKVLNANGTFAGTDITGYITDGAWTKTADATLTAKWEAKTTTITINANTANHGSTTPGTVTATYASALPSFTAASGASGYSLTGYYTDATSGTKIINADGTLVASTSYADGSGNWNSEVATLTLYAQYEEDETPCFQMVADASAGSEKTLSSGESITAGSKNCTTLSGGTAVYRNGASGTMKVQKPSPYGWYFGSSNDSIVITLTGSILQAGSVIKVSGNAGSSGCGFTFNASTSITKKGASGEMVDSTYTVKAGDSHLIGKNVIVVKRATGSATRMYSLSFSNCQSATPCTTPTLPSLSNQAGCSYTAWDATPTNASTITAAGESISYSWKKGATEKATTASYTPDADGTDYTVTVTVSKAGNIDASVTSSALTATKYTATSISTQPVTAVSADEGENFTLGTGMVAAGQGDLSYQWYSYTTSGGAGEASIGSATSATYTTSKAEAGTYYYKVKVTADCGTVASNMITVTVSEAPCFKFKCESQSSSVSAISSGSAITTSSWESGKATLSGGTMQNSGSASLGINKTYGIVLDGSTKEVTVTLGGDHVLAVGSVITLKAGVSDADGSQTSGLVVSGNTCSPASYTSSTAGAAFTQTYTVTALDGLAGTKSFTVAKKSDLTKTYLNGITVTGCEEVSYYSVTYAAGGAGEGTVPVDENSPYEAGETVTVLGNTGWLFKSGYNFAGWDSGNDGVKDYDEDETFTMPSSDVTLTAVWGSCTKPGTPTRPVIDEGTLTHTGAKFSWDPMGATANSSGYMVSIVKVSDGSTVLDWTDEGIESEGGAPVYTATGLAELTDYHFIVRAKGASGYCDYGDTARLTFGTLGTPYTITYHLNGASWINEGAATYHHGTGYTLPVAGDMSNTGYTFGGWYDNSGLTGSAVTEISAEATGDKEFWAKWTENTYTITYDANGGSGSMTGTTGHYVTIKDNGFTAPSGDTFVEWNTTEYGDGASYSPGDEIELTGDMTLYAIWAKAVTTINWSVTKVDGKLYRGGGGYSVTAEIDDANWDASASDASKLELTATEGVVLKNVTTSINGSGKAQITADFDITTDVDADSTKITFTLNVPENNDYAPAEDSHDEDLEDCGGGLIYAMHMTAYNTCEVNSTYGGSASLGGYSSSSSDNVTANEHTHYKPSGTLLTATLKSGLTFQAGDIVTLYMTASKDTKTTGYKICQSAGSSTLVQNVTEEMVSGTEYEVSATLTAAMTTIVGVSSIRLDRYNGDARFYGMEITRSSGGGGTVTPTLSWETDLTGGESKRTSDDNFVHTASQDMNSLGAITYSSNNTAVATVNTSTGEVHLEGAAGNATITATIAASGCFDESSISYTITVVDDCDDVAGTIETEDLGCDGIKMTVTGHTTTASTSYEWYKVDSPDELVATDQDNYTTTTAGSYYVIVRNTGDRHCAKRSRNTVTVEAQAAATATKIVDSWYVKNGRRTPDVELVQTTNAESFTVTNKGTSAVIWNSDGTTTTGFGGCGFHMDENGIIYLNGTTAEDGSGDAPSGLTGDADVTLTITAIGCGGNESKDITIHCQEATNYKEIAFVVDGDKGKGFDQVTSGHADGTELYEYLDSVGTAAGKRLFRLTEQNIYSTTDEKAIREHYSQFDAIIITDDPSTKKVNNDKDDYKTKGYVNAFGTMIDVRPILTMEAYVSALKNWGSKGIKGNPTSPNPRQYEMRLQCKDHEIYSGLPAPAPGTHVWSETIGGEEYRHVIMIDSTKSPYTGVAYNADTDDKPALQGFTAEAMGDLLGLGVISNGALQAGIERQEEPAARLLLLGVNAKALPNALTAEGKRVISNALTYLLKTNMEEVDDCSNYFTGKTSTDWNTVANWSKGSLPNYETKVRILAPCEVSGVTAHVAQVDIVSSGESSIRYAQVSDATCNGKLTINANGALIVEGKVRAADAPHFATNDLKPTTVNDLVLNTSSTNQAALIFNNDEGKTQATVNLYSLGRKVSETNQFQYMAIPMGYLPVSPSFANETYGGIKIYTYVWLEASGWERRGYYADLYAFEGVGITTDEALPQEYTMKGTLTSTKNQEIPITAENKKLNLIGNSWTAPIQISELEASDFGDASSAVEQTVYIYCTGHGNATSGDGTETPGQWLAIPFNATDFAAWEGLKVIPSMQSFQIKTTGAGTLTLDYKKHVRGGTTDLTEKLRAPKRKVETDGVELMRIRVADSQTHTDLYLFEGDQFTDEFDNGWEANYRVGTSESAKLYARVATGVMSVAAMPSLESTPVYFIPGQETEYMFTFGGEGMGYYLNDIKMQRSTLISTEATYSFTYEKGDAAARFYISKTPIDAGDTPTGWEGPSDQVKAQKIIYDNKLYIIVNGALYDATGKKVNSK